MAYKSFRYEGEISELLPQAPSEYRISWEYALFLLGMPRVGKPQDIFLYVPSLRLPSWIEYLQKQGAYETSTIPNIKLSGVAHLPRASPRDQRVVHEQQLLEDILHRMPARFPENNKRVLRMLRKKVA